MVSLLTNSGTANAGQTTALPCCHQMPRHYEPGANGSSTQQQCKLGDANELMQRQEHSTAIARLATTAILMLALIS